MTIDPRDAVRNLARSLTFMREINGANRSELIDAMIRRTGLDPTKRLPWCAAAVAWIGYAVLGKRWPLAKVAGCVSLHDDAKAKGLLRDIPAPGAIFLRVVLTFFAVMLLGLPWLKIVGGILLLYIGVKMLIPEEEEKHLDAHSKLWGAIKTIIVADFIMSLDNVLGVAAAAKGSLLLLILGLAISIPLIIYGSTFILKLMNRFPSIITIGGGVLGWVAGEMAIADPIVSPWVEGSAGWLHNAAPVIGALSVVAVGKSWAARKLAVPEPATASLVAFGLIGLAARRRA